MPDSEISRQGATGDHTVRGVPHGATSLTPYIGVPHAAEAVDFYRQVFDARIVELTKVSGVVVHAHLDFGNGHLHLEEPNPGVGLTGPLADGAACFSLGFYCHDVDAVLARAEAAAAEILAPAVDFPSGDRFVAIRDPHGVRWSIMSRVEDLSEAESAERIVAWAARGQGKD